METNIILQGDALEQLKTLPDESINCVMTSPPYWALRDYGIKGQLGLELTFTEYINKLCNIFDEIKRVLRKDGTCWVNIGDTYYGGGNNRGSTEDNLSKKQFSNRGARGQVNRDWKKTKGEMQDKCLCMIPQRFAIEMINRGWILRNDIIWYKPNCMPSSVKDRFTVDFEHIFFFVKNKKYWFENVKEEAITKGFKPFNQRVRDVKKGKVASFQYKASESEINATNSLGVRPNSPHYRNYYENDYIEEGMRNKRSVWRISIKGFSEAHFATYPEELCGTPLKAGCPIGGIVLDPFFGAGTTGLVALKQKKRFIGIELNPEYIQIAKNRLKSELEQTRITQEPIPVSTTNTDNANIKPGDNKQGTFIG